MAYDIDVRVDKRTMILVVASLKEVRRKLEPVVAKEIRNSVGPSLRHDIKASAATRLPRRGGLAGHVSKTARTTVGSGGRNVVRIRTTAAYRDDLFDRTGKVRHPVFGNRRVWVDQRITPGWWSRPVKEHHDDIMRAANHAIDKITTRFM